MQLSTFWKSEEFIKHNIVRAIHLYDDKDVHTLQNIVKG